MTDVSFVGLLIVALVAFVTLASLLGLETIQRSR